MSGPPSAEESSALVQLRAFVAAYKAVPVPAAGSELMTVWAKRFMEPNEWHEMMALFGRAPPPSFPGMRN